MEKQRLEELKEYVCDIRTNGWISLTKSDDLLTVLDEAIDRVDKENLTTDRTDSTDDSTRATRDNTGVTNFERWKAGLTIDEFSQIVDSIGNCTVCPAYQPCHFTGDRECSKSIKEWGEQYAD